MSRRSRAQRKLAEPDPIYNSRLVTLLVSRILQSGKKSLAQKIVYKALEIISAKTEENPVLILEKAVKNVSPVVELKSKRGTLDTVGIAKRTQGRSKYGARKVKQKN